MAKAKAATKSDLKRYAAKDKKDDKKMMQNEMKKVKKKK
jgi:hypothetical protein